MYYAIWIALFVITLIAEAMTAGLVSIWFSIGALGAIVATAFHATPMIQFFVFIAVSAIALVATRPFIKKIQATKVTPTNSDMIIGKTGYVTEDITPEKFAGAVTVAGKEWSAIANDNSTLKKGEKVKIISISGVKLIVERVSQIN